MITGTHDRFTEHSRTGCKPSDFLCFREDSPREGARLSTAWSASRSTILLSSTVRRPRPDPPPCAIPISGAAPTTAFGVVAAERPRSWRVRLGPGPMVRNCDSACLFADGGRGAIPPRWQVGNVRDHPLADRALSVVDDHHAGEVIPAFEAAGRPLEQRSCACDFVCLTTDDDPAARLRPSESFCRASGRWSSRSENRETEARGLWNNPTSMRTTSLGRWLRRMIDRDGPDVCPLRFFGRSACSTSHVSA